MALKVIACVWIAAAFAWAQEGATPWQEQVRICARQQNWNAAMRIVEREIVRAPQDLDAQAWRARVLLWSGRLIDAEHEYDKIIAADSSDADLWMDLATVYSREGRMLKAQKALDQAVAIDSKRADIHVARGQVFQRTKKLADARREFQEALALDRTSQGARAGLQSLRGEPRHEFRIGGEGDVFNFADANHDESLILRSDWTSVWRTNVGGSVYHLSGFSAQKFIANVTGTCQRLGAVTVGGSAAHDVGIIPKGELLFGYDRGWRLTRSRWVPGLETEYSQHWYWYAAARILTVSETMTLYFPRDWYWSVGITQARSHFSGTTAEWRLSGRTRITFPIKKSHERQLFGNLLYAAGTENFAELNQVSRFSSQTYGGGLRLRFSAFQDVTGFATYQKRSLGHTDIGFGCSYGIRF